MFVGCMGLMEGHTSAAALEKKFGDIYVPALLANWQVWPLIQLINFRYMPLRYVSSADQPACAIHIDVRHCVDPLPLAAQ